jgi:hypothetical protein
MYGSLIGAVSVAAISEFDPLAIKKSCIAAAGGMLTAIIYEKISDLFKSDVWIERTEK